MLYKPIPWQSLEFYTCGTKQDKQTKKISLYISALEDTEDDDQGTLFCEKHDSFII